MHSNHYNLIRASLLQADRALEVFNIGLSPTSLEALARHIAKHALGIAAAEPKPMDLIAIILGLMLKQTCDKEVQAFLKAEEAADAVKED